MIEDLRAKVGDVRSESRQQLAYRSGVSFRDLRKFQTPDEMPDFETLQRLIAHYYPDQMLAPNDGLQRKTDQSVEYFMPDDTELVGFTKL